MPHQPVEVERRRDACVRLEIDDLRLGKRGPGELAGDLRSVFKCGPVRHVHDDLKLTLVVEREHFHFDELNIKKRYRPEQQNYHRAYETPAQRRCVEQLAHESPVKARYEILAFTV